MFRSIAHNVDQDEEKHERCRRLTIPHMSINKNQFTHFLTNSDGRIDRYLQKMAQNSTWRQYFLGHGQI